MIKRYVLDGPPGSGKSTVLFGLSDGAKYESSIHTMEYLGYACIHESVAQAHAILADRGIDFSGNKPTWLQTIAEIDRDKFHGAKDGVNFYDRCFHHWKLLSDVAGIPLPDWYDALNAEIRYDDPIFLVAPVRSVDLAGENIHPSRRFTWEQRVAIHEQTRELYQGLGYRIVEVPVFAEGDIERNNRDRIDCILAEIE